MAVETGKLITLEDDEGHKALALLVEANGERVVRELEAALNDDGSVQVYLSGYAPE